jgi:putative membrane protein
MIDYDIRSWPNILFRARGSVIPRTLPNVGIAVAISVVAVLLYEHRGFKIPAVAHTLVGVALGLLLVFRTNTSYDRYWEGRKLLGSMVNRTRDLARQVANYITTEQRRAEIAKLIPAFYWLATQTLRRDTTLGRAEPLLTAEQRTRLEGVANRAPLIARWIGDRLRTEAQEGRLSENRLMLMDSNLTGFNDYIGGSERILKTPVPFAYAQHIKMFLMLFCFSVPFAVAEQMGWATPVAIGLLALALFGIDAIGVEIEDPFGDDPNDLPVEAIGEGIEKAVREIVAEDRAEVLRKAS